MYSECVVFVVYTSNTTTRRRVGGSRGDGGDGKDTRLKTINGEDQTHMTTPNTICRGGRRASTRSHCPVRTQRYSYRTRMCIEPGWEGETVDTRHDQRGVRRVVVHNI